MIINNINSLANISANSTTGITELSNNNFEKISEALYEFLAYQIGFEEFDRDDDENLKNLGSISLGSVTANVVKLNSKIELTINDTDMFTVDSNGKLFAKNIYAGTVNSALIHRHVYYEGFPKFGNPGDVVYGRNSDHPEIDLYGYIQNLGWLSLTGRGGGGTPSISEIVNWNGAVLKFVAEDDLPNPAERYGRYVITDGEHKGQIAQYNFLTNEYEFITPDDGTYIVDEETGTTYVYNSEDNNWKVESTLGIGESENKDGYNDGFNTDFTEKTTIGTAVDRFNKEIEYLYSKNLIAYKNIMGVASTSNYTEEYDEAIGGGIVLDGSHVFVGYINAEPSIAIEDGVVEYISNGHLEFIQKNEDSSYRVYKRVSGQKQYITNTVSPYYGENYRIKVYDQNGVEIEPKYYSLQYASGVIYFTKELPEDITPTNISLYAYIGKTVNDIVKSTSVRLSYADNERHISSSIANNMRRNPNVPFLTGIIVSEEPKKKSDFVVKVNGVSVVVGKTKDCYFNKVNTAKTFENIEQGDELVWNTQKAGFILDEDDVITFDYLVSDGDSGGVSPSPTPTPGGGSVTVELVAGENLTANSFVHIVNDRKVYKADSTQTDNEADGFILDSAAEGNPVTVYLSGVLEVPSVNGDVGDYVYLQEDGGYSSIFDADANCVLQNVASIVDSDKLYIHIYEPVILRESI